MDCRAPDTHTAVTLAAAAGDAMNKGVAAPTQIAATLPKARILLAPNTLTSCFEPPQGNAAERTLTYEEPRRSPPPRIWAFSRPSFVPHTQPDVTDLATPARDAAHAPRKPSTRSVGHLAVPRRPTKEEGAADSPLPPRNLQLTQSCT